MNGTSGKRILRDCQRRSILATLLARDGPNSRQMPIPSEAASNPFFEILAPDRQSLPFVFNSPHSGRAYPPEFLAASRLSEWAIRRSEDSFVDELFAPVVGQGAPLLKANFPRAWLDVNREPYELDPKMFAGRLPTYANIRSVRVAGGLGTIARIVSESEEIYSGPLAVDEGLARIDRVYKPYHAALGRLLATTRANFGIAVLIDCHSMPSTVRGGAGRLRPDVVIGDRYGSSCAPEMAELASEILTRFGYSVCRNKPYAGGYITEHYGKPGHGFHALQIEVNRALYLDEQRLERSEGFDRLREDLAGFVDALSAAFDSAFLGQRDAAE
jgi:N-formylglutamate amidohydrolase